MNRRFQASASSGTVIGALRRVRLFFSHVHLTWWSGVPLTDRKPHTPEDV